MKSWIPHSCATRAATARERDCDWIVAKPLPCGRGSPSIVQEQSDDTHCRQPRFRVRVVPSDGGGACGIAWLLGTSPADENYAYSVTALGCFTNRTFTHELGHNMGCCHAIGDGGGCETGGLYPFSNGWRFDAAGSTYRTIMAYAPGTRLEAKTVLVRALASLRQNGATATLISSRYTSPPAQSTCRSNRSGRVTMFSST